MAVIRTSSHHLEWRPPGSRRQARVEGGWLNWSAFPVAWVLIATFAGSGQAADRNSDFIAALRKQGWDDTAVEFIGWVGESPLATPEFLQELPYQRALSVAAQARQVRNRAERDRLLSQAISDFEAFAEKSDAPAAMDARRQIANLYAEQALASLNDARQLPAGQQAAARTKARELFAKSIAAAEQVLAATSKELASLPKAAMAQADPATKVRRDQLRDREVETRYLLARLHFEQANAFTPKSSDFKKSLNEASEQFSQLYEEYRQSVVGASSRLYQGRCAHELGDYEKALGCYEDILKSSDVKEEFRPWSARALRRRIETLLALDKVDDAIKRSEDWLTSSKPSERQQPEWLELSYRLADAYQAKLKVGKLSPGETKRLEAGARNLVRDASQRPNEFQQQAQAALASMSPKTEKGDDPQTFEEAFTAGKEAIDLWNSSNLAAKLARENNPEAVEELQNQATESRADAKRLFELALDLGNKQTPPDELNNVRYFLSILYWEDKQVYEAAVLAGFLATRYPESQYAAGAAKVALAAYETLAIEAQAANPPRPGDPPPYEATKLAELAELVASRWPDSPEASSAVNALVQTALRENRLADAEALLQRLPAESRGPAQMSLGAGLWTQYLRATAGKRDAPGEETIALREKSGAMLSQGFAVLREKGTPNVASAVGALYLAQFLLAKGDAEQAIGVLEDKKAGPLALVESGAEAGAKPEFALETYKTALRAYLSAEAPDREKAEQMMKALEKVASKGAGGQKLTDVYLGLGVQLQRQMKELNAAGQQEKAASVAAAFGDLLKRVSERPDAKDWRVRGWIAQTNLQLGQELTGDAAKPYIDQAKTTFQAMLDAAAKDPKYAPDEGAILGVRMRLAECLNSVGDQAAAVKQLGEILRDRPNMLDIQKSAAQTLQAWGTEKRDLAVLDRSVRGDLPQPNGQNLIWGWVRLATIANSARAQAEKTSPATDESRERAERFKDLFFEARYNVANVRFLAGKMAPADSKRSHLEAAKTNIDQMAKLYPDLGGPSWKPAFDELLKQVNLELEKK